MWVTWASMYMPVSAGVGVGRCEGLLRIRGAGIVMATNAGLGTEGVLLTAAAAAKAISSEAVAGSRARPFTLHALRLSQFRTRGGPRELPVYVLFNKLQ
jgi:hypothetical protein